MLSHLLPKLMPISVSEEYPFYRAKMEIYGKWYAVNPHHTGILMLAVPFRINETHYMTGFKCQECRRTFLSLDVPGLYHECNGVED
jgi:hypothetical protein